MGCYLCAYLSGRTPATPRPLPPTSPVATGDELGTCWKCSISACAAHASRYGRYECAICTPAAAAEMALGAAPRLPAGAPNTQASAVRVARLVGENSSSNQKQRVRQAIDRLREDQSRPYIEGLDPFGNEEPNLIWNLAGVIREEAPDLQFVPKVRDYDWEDVTGQAQGELSVDAIAATARERLLGADIGAQLRPSTTDTVTGALLLAVTVADQAATGPGDRGSVDPSSIDVRAPWAMTHPALLDPVMWPIAVAYRRGD